MSRRFANPFIPYFVVFGFALTIAATACEFVRKKVQVNGVFFIHTKCKHAVLAVVVVVVVCMSLH